MSRAKQPGRGWAYTGALLGGLVSIAANVAHSFLPPVEVPQGWAPEPGAVVGAVVWPVFLFVAVEILARTSWPHGWSWGLLRWAGLVPVAGVAAFVSYRHLSGLLAHYGEDAIVTIVGPLAVDGLMIMATGAIIAGKRAVANLAHAAVVLAPTELALTVTTPVAPATTPPVTTAVAAPVSTVPQQVTPTPAPPSATPQPTTRANPPKRPTPKPAAPTQTAIDIHVTEQGLSQRPSTKESGLLRRARTVAEGHKASTGHSITAGELATRLRVREKLAQQLLNGLGTGKDLQGPAPVLNGTPVETATR